MSFVFFIISLYPNEKPARRYIHTYMYLKQFRILDSNPTVCRQKINSKKLKKITAFMPIEWPFFPFTFLLKTQEGSVVLHSASARVAYFF